MQEQSKHYRDLVANGECTAKTRRFDPHQKISVSVGDVVDFFRGNDGNQTVCRKNIKYEFCSRFCPELLDLER